MKLETKGPLIMLIASLLLLAGCKQKSGMEILNDRMSNLKALRSQYTVQKNGKKDIVINVIFQSPNRVLVTSEDFVVALNENDGHFESVFSDGIYDHVPYDGHVYPGTGKLVPTDYLNAGPASANPPSKIVPESPWKLESKNGTIERYAKTMKTMEGPRTFKLEITDKGVPVMFDSGNGTSFHIKSFELLDSIPFEKFRVEPKDGFVNHRTAPDVITFETGDKFVFSQFKAADDVSQFKLEGNTMFVLVDPMDPTSLGAIKWMKSAGSGFRKIAVSKGNALSGFYDPTGSEIDKLTSTTPMFVMVDKSSKITGMWFGFDSAKIPEFEKDIQALLAGD